MGEMKLDFSKLFDKQPQTTKKPAAKKREGLEDQQSMSLYLNKDRELKVYKQYQHNIRESEMLQHSILKGLAAGEDLGALFLQAVKAIADGRKSSFRTSVENPNSDK